MPASRTPTTTRIVAAEQEFSLLSLPDLLAARDLYHRLLMSKSHVVGTAVGRYLIRDEEPWPRNQMELKVHDTRTMLEARAGKPRYGPRTLANSDFREYSWPCILVFVDHWSELSELEPEAMVPRSLQLPGGSRVPVCVVWAPPVGAAPPPRPPVHLPEHFVGGGYPLWVSVQGREHFASVGCLVSDGHAVYALTNRHVTGGPGEPVYAVIGGERIRIGESADRALNRRPFEEVYPGWSAPETLVNLDVGLVKLDDLSYWTAQVFGVGAPGEVADLSQVNISLRLIGACVRGFGAASGVMRAQILGLFYRYRSLGGFDYVSDFILGPRDVKTPLDTHPGDSGTLWLLEPHVRVPGVPAEGAGGAAEGALRPIALQWGGQRFHDPDAGEVACALATCLSTACRMLEVDVIRDWNAALPEYWGAVGHYTIASKAVELVRTPTLRALMGANLERITYPLTEIDRHTGEGLSLADYCPLADVPDMVWKIGGKGIRRGKEKPNHFADMDRKDSQGRTLLEICGSSSHLDPDVWLGYYQDPKVNDRSKGCLPFRVWQFYDALVGFARERKLAEFVCAAGILSHYVGDACQPLHISYLFNGDPDHGDEGKGVHAAYEDGMVNRHIEEIRTGLGAAKPKRPRRVRSGRAAAAATVALMRETLGSTPPSRLVSAYASAIESDRSQTRAADALWAKFGAGTVANMAAGAATLAMLWDAAWTSGSRARKVTGEEAAFSESSLKKLYVRKTFLPSYDLDEIGQVLT